MIGINARFTPFRMVLKRREPVELRIELTNKSAEEKMASLELKISPRLSLDRVGYKTSDIKRLPKFNPGEKKTFYYEIWPKNPGAYSEEKVVLRILEHKGNYSEVENEVSEDMSIKIE
jgi:hypothetical protein